MASISPNGKNRYLIRVFVNGKQEKIYGFTNRREAERAADKIDMLVTAQKTGDTPAEVAVWAARLAESNSALYDKLARLGLVETRTETRTLGELFEKHHASRRDVTRQTHESYQRVERNLIEYFGLDCDVESITFAQADEYATWLRETPLNRRKAGAEPYSPATANKRVNLTKQIFHYAKKIGWVKENPFQFLRGGASVNHEKWFYVDRETAETVINACPLPKWRAIMALGRFAGVRGSSELYAMKWEHVRWSSAGEPGKLLIKAEKNKRHGREFRTVPMLPIVERELATLFDQAAEGEPCVFPGMEKKTNFGTMTQKMVSAAGVPVWPNIWYNLRKSFCSDLMQTHLDPAVYEAMTDHSYAMAMKHYQIAHTARLEEGYERFCESFSKPQKSRQGLKYGLLNETENNADTEKSSMERGLEYGLVTPPEGLKAGLQSIPGKSVNAQQESLSPINYDFPQENKKRPRVYASDEGRGTGTRTPTK